MSLHRLPVVLAALFLLLPSSAQEITPEESHPFPPDSALANDVDPAKLEQLGAFVRELCEAEELVGAELLVIKNGRTLLHEAFGWADRDEERPMVVNTVFCVRSMTKPVIGTAIQMLADEKKLKLGDPVAKYLACFDTERSRGITVEQLLQHTGGLPLTLLTQQDLEELTEIAQVAEIAAEHGPDFEPGTEFEYSDPGADTLAALVEVASGVPLEEFVQQRILDPLGMRDTTCRMSEGHPLRQRAASSYAGRRGDWTRFWSPAEPPIFPFLLGSQSLYSTPIDYARFLELWRLRGKAGGERLLSTRAIRRALEPGPHTVGLRTGLSGLTCEYGQLWQLWIDPEVKKRGGVVAFGHGGSDGTQSWVFPDEKLMVLLFSQSRGHGVGMLIEEKVDQLLRGAEFDPNALAPELSPLLGLYVDHDADRYLCAFEENGRLAIEMPGRMVLETRYAGEDSWKLALDPRVSFSFTRAENGAVTGLRIQEPNDEAVLVPLVPAEDLPSVEELVERLVAAHRVDLLAEIGAVRLSGSLKAPARKVEGRLVQLFAAPDRLRVEIDLESGAELVVWDGEHAVIKSGVEGRVELEGARREQAGLESFLSLARDWRTVFREVQPLMRVPGEEGGEHYIVVRAVPREALPVTLVVGEESGRLLQHLRISEAPMVGRIGASVKYSDFRDVGGMLLPFKQESRFPSPLIGTVTFQIEEAEVGVEVTDADFIIPEGESE